MKSLLGRTKPSTGRGFDMVGVRDIHHWWRDHRLEFPGLSDFARNTFSVMATSAANERVFSVNGHSVKSKSWKVLQWTTYFFLTVLWERRAEIWLGFALLLYSDLPLTLKWTTELIATSVETHCMSLQWFSDPQWLVQVWSGNSAGRVRIEGAYGAGRVRVRSGGATRGLSQRGQNLTAGGPLATVGGPLDNTQKKS